MCEEKKAAPAAVAADVLERIANEPPINGNNLAAARVMMAAQMLRDQITEAAPVAQGDALTYEQSYAIRQGHEIASSDAYFEARPQIDNNDRRGVFRAGFDRGWDAARAQAKEVASHG